MRRPTRGEFDDYCRISFTEADLLLSLPSLPFTLLSALSQRLFSEDITPHKPQPKARDVARAAAEDASATPSGAETPISTEGEAETKAEEKAEEKVEETPAAAVVE